MDATHPSPHRTLGFRPLSRDDLPMLARWLAQPHVQRWWQHNPAPGAVEADFGPSVDGADPTEVLIVAERGRPVGLVQRYRIGDHPEWHHALAVVDASPDAVGIDYLIGEPHAIGRGLGTAMIRQFVDDVWRRYPAAPAVVVAVQQHNPASWRALENVGFRRVWSGTLQSDDASDAGPSHICTITRPSVDAAPTSNP